MFEFLRKKLGESGVEVDTSPWVFRRTPSRPVDDARRNYPLKPYTVPLVDVTGIGGIPVRRSMAPLSPAVAIVNQPKVVSSVQGSGNTGFIGFYPNPLTDAKNVGLPSQGI